MYQIVNGILEENGKKVYAIGESYYPSFHHGKYPVPPDGDRIGEMKKDIRLMSEAGINHIRFAALDEFGLDETDNVWVKADFVDSMLAECGKNNISASVRLQGYVTNLRGHKNVLMIDGDGNEQDTTRWSDFIQTTFHHEGMLKDDRDHTRALAKHFADDPNVVAFQIYNEPHYPGTGSFDYHLLAIAAFRKWLVDKGLMSPEDAESYLPPRVREEQTPEAWALFRDFSRESLTAFLKNAGDACKESTGKPTYTCLTDCSNNPRFPIRGIDVFRCADNTEISGYTDYAIPEGAAFFEKELNACINVDAAAALGKTAWNVELDCRRVLPGHMFLKGIYATIASGVKGILFYQWRGDAPGEFTPNPNSCGALNYDGTRTAKYDDIMKGIRLLQRLSDDLVEVYPRYDDIAILYSAHALSYADSVENRGNKAKDAVTNSVLEKILSTFSALLKMGYRPQLTDIENIKTERIKASMILAPAKDKLSEEEIEVLKNAQQKGAHIYVTFKNGYVSLDDEPRLSPLAKSNCPTAILVEELSLALDEPAAVTSTPLVIPWMLSAPDRDLIVLTNTAGKDAKLPAVEIKTVSKFKSAVLVNEDFEKNLEIIDGKLRIDNPADIKNGAVIILRQKGKSDESYTD